MRNINSLLKNELYLTLYIIFGLLIGEFIIKLKIPEILMKKFTPFLKRNNIPASTGFALAVSTGSSKAGAAIIASALEEKQISEYSAIWSVLMLSLPSYLRRWFATLALSVSMAGISGAIFALSLLFQSVGKFFTALFFLKRNKNENENFNSEIEEAKIKNENQKSKTKHEKKYSFLKKLIKTLPLAWIFFALAYSLVPVLNKFFQEIFINSKVLEFLPLAGWTVAAGSVARVSVALALAGGALSSGELNIAQAVFALILGSGLGTATRLLRMNAGYYFGFFPARTAAKMLLTNFIVIMSFFILNLFFAIIFLLIK